MFSKKFYSGDIKYWGDSNVNIFNIDCAIRGEYELIDESIRAAFRALMYRRPGKRYSLYGERYYYDGNMNNFFTHKFEALPQENLVYFVGVETSFVKETRAALDTEEFSKTIGMKPVKNIEDYVRAKTGWEFRFFTDEETERTAIFVLNPKAEKIHLAFTFISRYLPNLFGKFPLTEKEKEMVLSFCENDESKFVSAINNLTEEYHIEDFVLDVMIGNFRKNAIQTLIMEEDRQAKNMESQRREYLNSYNKLCDALNEIYTKLEALKMNAEKAGDETDVLDFFKTHKNFHFETSANNKITFTVETFLDIYDADDFENFAKNGSIFTGYGWEPEDVKLLLSNIFNEDPKMHIGMCASYTLGLGGYVMGNASHVYDKNIIEHCMANPHIDYHGCLGNHLNILSELMEKCNIVGALEQCAGSAASVNINEVGATFRPFIQRLLATDRKVIEVIETKERLSPKEALKMLKGE